MKLLLIVDLPFTTHTLPTSSTQITEGGMTHSGEVLQHVVHAAEGGSYLGNLRRRLVTPGAHLVLEAVREADDELLQL